MPIYEYVCRSCQHPFEELVRSSDQEVRCPRCQSSELRKQMSVFSSSVKESPGPVAAPAGAG